jgi:osmotically-inducible protein OsmY
MQRRRRTQLLIAILIFIAAVALPACSRQPAPSTEGAADLARTDEEITTAVQAQFYAEPMVRDARINVSTANHVVTLSGTAGSEQARQRSIELAREVDGVTSVEDRMMVTAADAGGPGAAAGTGPRAATADPGIATRTPGWITTKIQAQYFVSPSIKPWNIDVTTSSAGVVTLEGQVDSMEAKNDALRIARSTEGVARVEDQLRVTRETAATTGLGETDLHISDAWLTAKIRSKYYMDDAVRARDIDVTTDGAAVTLEGTVGSAEERRRAVTLARSTEGVREVRDRLQVQAPATATGEDVAPRRSVTGATVAQGIEDAWVTTKIQSQYFLEPEVKGHQIDVDTRDGVVTLSGSVETEARKQQAEQIARDTEAVTRVINRLTVSAQP